MKKMTYKTIIVLTLLALVLGACGGSTPEEPAISEGDAVLTEVSKSVTLTAEAMPPTSTPLPLPSATATLEPVVNLTESIPTNSVDVAPTTDPNITPIASLTAFPTPTTSAPAGDISCYKAAFGSEGPPYDNTQIYGGKTFIKTWRIKNTGTCTWSTEVYLRWQTTYTWEDGVRKETNQLLGQKTAIAFVPEAGVAPGQSIEIEVEFSTPELLKEAQTFQLFFVLGSPAGVFTIGGGAIWVMIEVLPP